MNEFTDGLFRESVEEERCPYIKRDGEGEPYCSKNLTTTD